MRFGSAAAVDNQKGDAVYTFDRPRTTEKTYVRGSLFAPVPGFMQQYLGTAAWNDVLRRVEPVTADVLKTEFVALAWYPFRIITNLVDALDAAGKAAGKKNPIKDMTAFNLDHATRGLFRAIFKLGSPEFMVSRSDQIWQRFYSTGQMTIPKSSKGEAVVKLQWVPDMTPLYSMAVMHSLEAVIVKAGGRMSHAEITKDMSRGAQYSEYLLRWT